MSEMQDAIAKIVGECFPDGQFFYGETGSLLFGAETDEGPVEIEIGPPELRTEEES